MLTYWEWAAIKGISYRTTSTEKEYHEYLAAAGEPVEPYVPPPPTPPTVTVVNRLQAVKVAGLRPESAYSRIVTIGFNMPSPPGQDFAVSDALGNVLRLLSVDVWITGSGMPVATTWWFDLRRGIVLPTTTLQVQQWDYVLPVKSTTGIWIFNGQGNPVHRHWDMNVMCKGTSQRFAIIGNMIGPATSYFTASFRISEG